MFGARSRNQNPEKIAVWRAALENSTRLPEPPIIAAALEADLIGAIEDVRDGTLSGWIDFRKSCAVPPTILLIDGEDTLLEFVPHPAESALPEPGAADSQRSFAIALPERVFDGCEHSLSLRRYGDDSPISGTRRRMVLTPELTFQGERQLRGEFKGIRGMMAHGWAYDANDPAAPVTIEILDGDLRLASGIANEVREDAAALVDGNVLSGFRIRIPDAYLDGRRLTLSAREPVTGTVLANTADPAPPTEHPGWSATVSDLEGQVLCGQVTLESTAEDQDVELELWIDGIWADRFHVSSPGRDRDRWNFQHAIPDSVRDGNAWTSVLDGESHEFVLTPADTSLVLSTGHFVTPVKVFTYSALKAALTDQPARLPRFVRRFIARACASALFDGAFYGARVQQTFASAEHAILHYLSDRRQWRHATSPWLDLPFVNALAGDLTKDSVSPLEWYIRQGPDSEFGPNPLFANVDYRVFADGDSDSLPQRATFFDDWLATLDTATPLNPSALVDISYLQREIGGDHPATGAQVLRYLRDWLALTPAQRPLDTLSPYFSQDWLEQCFILRRNRPKGCLLSAFRLGQFGDQSPHPVLQSVGNGRDYYALIRDYELLQRSSGIDDIERLCPNIDADALYAQFPAQPTASTAGPPLRSSLYRYLMAPVDTVRRSFLRNLDDHFVADVYEGLIEYCTATRGISDINLIWARWLRLLMLPGTYEDSVRTGHGLLTVQDLRQLRSHQPRLDRGISLSLIIPTYARDDLVLRCVLSAVQSGNLDQIEFIIAEDAEQVDSGWILGYFLPSATIYKNPENLGFLANCMSAVAHSTAEFFVLVNNDIIVHQHAVHELLDSFRTHADAGVIGGLILNADGSIQENGGLVWKDASAWNFHRNWQTADEYAFNLREADYVSGCWIGFRRAVWDRLGGFDTRFMPAYYEESDFCLSCWSSGSKVYVNPLSVVTHLDGATMGVDEEDSSTLKAHQPINRKKFHAKWKPLLAAIFNDNGNPTPFHTGRRNPKRFITLVFDHYVPEPDRDAGSRTMFVVCQALAAMANNYVIFVPGNNHRSAYAKDLERLGIEIIAGAEGWKRLDLLLEHEAALIKYAFVSRLGVAEKFSWHLNRLKCRKSLYIHDIEALRGFTHDPRSPGYEALVKAALSNYTQRHQTLFDLFDDIISLSEEETRLLQPYYGRKLVDVFPYDFPSAAEVQQQNRNDLIFVGSYNHPPNREAIAHFIASIWSQIRRALPHAWLHLCGSGFERAQSLTGPGVICHGLVSEQTLSYLYAISRVSIAPLLTGAGMKGKVIESCSRGVPCVGTEVAWQGIDLPAKYAHLRGSMDTFADRLIATYQTQDEAVAADLVALYDSWRGRNRIADVIPRLAEAGVRG